MPVITNTMPNANAMKLSIMVLVIVTPPLVVFPIVNVVSGTNDIRYDKALIITTPRATNSNPSRYLRIAPVKKLLNLLVLRLLVAIYYHQLQ